MQGNCWYRICFGDTIINLPTLMNGYLTMPQMPFSQHKPDLAILILQYLVKHPSAKDTIEGIVTWWILKERIDQSVEKVSRALELLVAREFVLEKSYHNQRSLYELNKDKLSEIKNLLSELNE